jgi:hypothetical protein
LFCVSGIAVINSFLSCRQCFTVLKRVTTPVIYVQYCMGQQVCLINPKNVKQKVAVGIVSGFGRIDKFHFNTIPESWLKVDVKEVVSPNADLMYPNENANQHLLKDVVGGNTVWDVKFIRRA